ncbi:hypothetical protein C7R93_15505 [Brevibacillus fortis]|uniref:Uncharacterized protein n=1 Tax=Brevibacillus fortis TaxID=2126352 RepID=A0A2P7V6D8_9BACL|nr:hypothetical protein C7R93_15505 [Brevibacillus fortis]
MVIVKKYFTECKPLFQLSMFLVLFKKNQKIILHKFNSFEYSNQQEFTYVKNLKDGSAEFMVFSVVIFA